MTTSSSAPFGVPYRPVPGFVGRETELAWLEAALTPARTMAVVCGLGGLGKTQLAVEFAHAARDRFPGGVFWLTMDPPAGIAAQVAAYAGPEGIDLPEWDPARAEANQTAVQWAWQEPVVRLLVFDSLDDPAWLEEWRPPLGGCRVLITSRNRLWPAAWGHGRCAWIPCCALIA